MTDYNIRTQVLLDVKLRNELDKFKDRFGYISDSMAIREALKVAFEETEKTEQMLEDMHNAEL